MNLEEAKFELSKKVFSLKKLLQERDIDTFGDNESEKEMLSFNGWATLEGFEHTIKYELIIELHDLIHLCYLNELDEEKRRLLVETIIDEISFSNYINTYRYQEITNNLDASLIRSRDEFLQSQEELRELIINDLKAKYLLQQKVDLKKIAKFEWLGEQKELAELFDQLKRKNWIKVSTNNAAYYRAISALFSVDGSESLESNLKDYHSARATKPITTQGLFSTIPPNPKK